MNITNVPGLEAPRQSQ